VVTTKESHLHFSILVVNGIMACPSINEIGREHFSSIIIYVQMVVILLTLVICTNLETNVDIHPFFGKPFAPKRESSAPTWSCDCESAVSRSVF